MIHNAQFENINSLRLYPFADDSSLVDKNGKVLSQDVIVDAHIYVPGENCNKVVLSSVHISPYMVSACFKCMRNSPSSSIHALSVSVAVENFKPYFPYMLTPLAGTNNTGGVVTFGNFDFPGFAETYFFENAALLPCCVSMSGPAKLNRFIDPRTNSSISGDVNITFSDHITSTRTGNSVSLAIDSESESDLASECARTSESDACGAMPIASINGIYPDEDGNIVLWFH